MYCGNYTGTVSHVLCREVYKTLSLVGRAHCQRFHCATEGAHTHTNLHMLHFQGDFLSRRIERDVHTNSTQCGKHELFWE